MSLQAVCKHFKARCRNPSRRPPPFFLFGALQLFFFDGNKRTSRFMMNGILMSAGIDAISVSAAKAQAFNENMVRFYLAKDATVAMHHSSVRTRHFTLPFKNLHPGPGGLNYSLRSPH